MAPKTSDTPNKSGKAHHGSAARVKAQHQQSASLNQSGHSSVAGLHASHASTGSALGTPGRKSDLYAGPTFHHSPAPAKLPPPPFLSSSMPGVDSALPAARSLLSFPGVGGPAGYVQGSAEQVVDASPLGFLFRAKEREEQWHSVHGSMSGGNMLDLLFQQPSAPVQQQQPPTRFGAHSPTHSMDYTTDDESVFADFASPIVPSSAQFGPGPGALGGAAGATQTAKPAGLKKPAWQPIERPPTIPLSQIQQEPEVSFAPPPPGPSGVPRAPRAKQPGATEASQPRKQAAGSQGEKTVRVRKQDKQDGGKDTTQTASNMTASTTRRRKKEVNGAPASPAAPKAILKREPAAGEASTISKAGAPMTAMQQPGAAQGSVKANRQSSASEFKLLKKPTAPSAQAKTVLLKHAKRDSKSASPVPLATASGSFTLPDENELDDAALLQDASALVKLLSLNPAAETDRPMTPLSQPAALQQSVIGTPRDKHVVASGSSTTTNDVAMSMTTHEDDQSQADQQAESALQRMLGLSTTTSTTQTHTHIQASSRLASPGQNSPKEVKQAGQADTSALEMDLRKMLQLSA